MTEENPAPTTDVGALVARLEPAAWRYRHRSSTGWHYANDIAHIQRDIDAGWHYEVEPLYDAAALQAESDRADREKARAEKAERERLQLARSLNATAGNVIRLEAALTAAQTERDVLHRVAVAAAEFIGDWRKGDFNLPKLAELDAQSMESALNRIREATDV